MSCRSSGTAAGAAGFGCLAGIAFTIVPAQPKVSLARSGAGAERPATALVADRDGDRVPPAASAGIHPDQTQQVQVGVQQLQIGAGQVDPVET